MKSGLGVACVPFSKLSNLNEFAPLLVITRRSLRHLRKMVESLPFEDERASYNGSIEASQASDVGSIPIARSRFKRSYTKASFSIFSKTSILLPNFEENSVRICSRGISLVYRAVIVEDVCPIC